MSGVAQRATKAGKDHGAHAKESEESASFVGTAAGGHDNASQRGENADRSFIAADRVLLLCFFSIVRIHMECNSSRY